MLVVYFTTKTIFLVRSQPVLILFFSFGLKDIGGKRDNSHLYKVISIKVC